VHDRFSELLRWWPNAKFIFLTRDPRDVARSVIRMGWAGNGWHGSDRWVTAVDEAHALQQQVDADNWHRVSYEKLVATPVEELQALCEFLQVPWNDGLLAYPDSTTYHYPSPEAAFRWKTNAPLNEVALVEARVGMRLALLGYDARLLQPPSINSLQLFFLRLQNRCARIQFRLRRYGTWNVLMGAWTARLGPQKAAHHFILKMQHIDDILVQ